MPWRFLLSLHHAKAAHRIEVPRRAEEIAHHVQQLLSFTKTVSARLPARQSGPSFDAQPAYAPIAMNRRKLARDTMRIDERSRERRREIARRNRRPIRLIENAARTVGAEYLHRSLSSLWAFAGGKIEDVAPVAGAVDDRD